MRKYQRFEEMPVWQEASRLYQRVLDIVEEPNVPLSAPFRTQLERASLAVSSRVAEGYEGVSTSELLSLLGEARGAAVEIQSMIAIVSERAKVARLRGGLQEIRTSAEACARQLGNWKYAMENPGKRQTQAGPAAESGASAEKSGFAAGAPATHPRA